MDRERVIAFMQRHGLNNRQLAERLRISEDKVSKSLATRGKPRRWQGDEVVKLMALMESDPAEQMVRTEVRGTGMSPEDIREALALRGAKSVPLLGTAFGSEWPDDVDVETTELRLSEVLDNLARPPSLAGDDEAYAVTVIGDSMAPRFEPGEIVFVSPKSTVSIGDDVIVQIRGRRGEQTLEGEKVTDVLIKRLVRRSASFVELRQFNPEKIFRVPADRVSRIHRVRGRL
jgi:SOS-response transcriptional repressor LexA